MCTHVARAARRDPASERVHHRAPPATTPIVASNATVNVLLDEDLLDITEPRPTKNVYFEKSRREIIIVVIVLERLYEWVK